MLKYTPFIICAALALTISCGGTQSNSMDLSHQDVTQKNSPVLSDEEVDRMANRVLAMLKELSDGIEPNPGNCKKVAEAMSLWVDKNEKELKSIQSHKLTEEQEERQSQVYQAKAERYFMTFAVSLQNCAGAPEMKEVQRKWRRILPGL